MTWHVSLQEAVITKVTDLSSLLLISPLSFSDTSFWGSFPMIRKAAVSVLRYNNSIFHDTVVCHLPTLGSLSTKIKTGQSKADYRDRSKFFSRINFLWQYTFTGLSPTYINRSLFTKAGSWQSYAHTFYTVSNGAKTGFLLVGLPIQLSTHCL